MNTATASETNTYRFEVAYERLNSSGALVTGSTLVTAKRPNFSLTGAQDRLRARFKSSPSIKAVSIRPYVSGSDLVKRHRQDKRAREVGAW